MHCILSTLLCLFFAPALVAAPASHPPMRPLPGPSRQPLGDGSFRYADTGKGDDAGDGSRDKPWKTITHALTKLAPGETLLLRGGTYYETVTLSLAGTAARPIALRSHPGELAIIDGGLREFFEHPAKAWEPAEGGAKGEYRSTKTYPILGEMILGHFGDSMIPLHGYRHPIDLRSDNAYWTLKNKLDDTTGFYCGPGLWFDARSQRLHVRLAHTNLAVLGDDNYRGETDPRKLPVCVAGLRPSLRIESAKHVSIQDIVVRGGSRTTISLVKSQDVTLDGVTAFGGSPALRMQGCERVRITHSAFRGIAAPWGSRAGHKYRGPPSYVFIAEYRGEPNRDVEIAHSELTDSHDGPYIGTIKGLKLHHCLVDNFNDDGIYLTAAEAGGDVHIYQNYISRCLHAFSYHGNFKPGSGVKVYRNLIDLRRPVPYMWPEKADDPNFPEPKAGEPRRWPWTGRLCGDHGSPVWEPLAFYHNTVIWRDSAFRDYYGGGWGGHVNSKRAVFNNIFVQLEGNPGLNFDVSDGKLLQIDGNLLWSLRDGPKFQGDFFAAFRASERFKASQKGYKPGWTASDRFADPMLTSLSADYRVPLDARLKEGSPAIDSGVSLPAGWPDPLRGEDKGKPDMGALPLGAMPFKVGR